MCDMLMDNGYDLHAEFIGAYLKSVHCVGILECDGYNFESWH